MRFTDGQVYEGTWINGKKNGSFLFTDANGERKREEWLNGEEQKQG